MKTKSIVVLISGNGSNLQALIDAWEQKDFANGKIVLVVSNRKNAYGLQRAMKSGIPSLVSTLASYKKEGKTREDYDSELADEIIKRIGGLPDLIVLAGWMHILSPKFLDKFPNRIINLHPGLPGQFDGANAIEKAYEAFKRGEIKKTGVMVHYVIPEVDKGRVICSEEVEIRNDDTLEALEDKIHSIEHKILVKAVKKLLDE